ncbi:hypothetical protein IX332_001441 [Porphyromonas levii]|nr:hypothetical protein [Porphyromonas levii]MBR8730109.1 hypothetical protein [Porphyromonas levii]MBR8730708.1 hypothetical protein [Porphyromonas levii]MBR8759136.1 hypothetical protein [Porphyromonas levii]MBR8764839.1 hypothetical protein [Porphyromonas levii]
MAVVGSRKGIGEERELGKNHKTEPILNALPSSILATQIARNHILSGS